VLVSGLPRRRGCRAAPEPLQPLTLENERRQAGFGHHLVVFSLVQVNRFAWTNRLVDTIRTAHFS